MKSKETNDRRNDIIHGSSRPEVSVSGGVMGDTTGNKGMKLAEINNGDWLELIAEALAAIPMEYKLLIKFKYFENKTNDMAAESLHISRALYYAWKENTILCICLLATQKGLIDPMENLRIG
ncbi:hypothetical protein [Desulfosporosinus lacus]|nr:hypothetical protein [Desulfosporosinus lacus]